jgi:hypothetical protein
MQLIRLNTLPVGRRANGLFVALFDEVQRGSEPSDDLSTEPDRDQSNAGMTQLV